MADVTGLGLDFGSGEAEGEQPEVDADAPEQEEPAEDPGESSGEGSGDEPSDEPAEDESEEGDPEDKAADEEDKEGEEPEEDQAPEAKPAKKARPGRKERLAAANDELKRGYAEMQQRTEQMFQQLQEQNQRELDRRDEYYGRALEQANQQVAALNARLQQADDLKEEEGLSAQERFERKLEKRAREAARQEASPEIQKLREELAERDRQAAEHQARVQEKVQLDDLSRKTVMATRGLLEKHLQPEVAKSLMRPTENMVLAMSAALGKSPEVAVKDLESYMERWYKERKSAEVRAIKGRISGKGGLPSTSGASVARATGQGGTRVTKEELLAAGYDNRFEAQGDGYKRVLAARAGKTRQAAAQR